MGKGKIFLDGIGQQELLASIKAANKELFSDVEQRISEAIKEEMSLIVEVVDRKLTTRQAGRILHCEEQTVRKHVHSGLLKNANPNPNGQFRFWLSDVINLRHNWQKYQRNYVQ